MRKTFILNLLAIVGMLLAGPGHAQREAVKPIRIIVTFAAGGPSDVLARAVGEELGKRMGRPVVVDNRPGANGIIGAGACKAAPADGSTLCLFLNDAVTINPAVYKKLPYDADKDFRPVVNLAGLQAAIVVAADLPVNSLKELAEFDHRNPGRINWGSFGVGSSSHLYMLHINKAMGLGMTHVPYSQGAAALVTSFLGGEVHASLLAFGLVDQWIQKGKMRAIAVLGDGRSSYFPGVPSAKEQGVGMGVTSWFGLFAPAATPDDVVQRVNQHVNEILQSPAFVASKLQPHGFVAAGGSPRDLQDKVVRDRAEWIAVANASNVRLD